MTDTISINTPRQAAGVSSIMRRPATTATSNGGTIVSGGLVAQRKQKLPKKTRLHPMDAESVNSAVGSTAVSAATEKSHIIAKKKDLIEAVRRLSPMYSVSKTSLHTSFASYRNAASDDSELKQQVTIVENGVNSNARRYHDLKSFCDRKAHELKARLDTLQTMKAENDVLQQFKHRQTPESRRIAELEHEISSMTLDIEKKQHYSRVLDHMLKRLHTNQVKYDGHMNGMEDTCIDISKEETQMKLLFRQMEAGFAQAQKDLQDTEQRVAVERKERELIMIQRRAEYQNAERLKEWMIKRDEMRFELATELRGDLSKEKQEVLRSQLANKEEETRQLRQAAEVSQKVVHDMEEAFQRIKQVTGVSNLDEMVEKFARQKSSVTQLETEVKDAEEQLASVKSLKDQKDRAYMELRAIGVGSAELNRGTTERLEEEITRARVDARTAKAFVERTSTTLVSLRQGAQGLLQRLQPYANLIDMDDIDIDFTGDDAVDCLDALALSEQLLSKMLEQVGDTSPSKLQQMAVAHGLIGDTAGDSSKEEAMSPSTAHQLGIEHTPAIVNNVRVKSRSQFRYIESQLHRPNEDSIHNDRSIEYQIDGSTETEPKLDEDGHVPSRLALKNRSEREHAEYVRRQEHEAKRRNLQEKIAGAGEKERAKLLSQAAKRKTQLEAASRLSQAPPSPTVPPGITLRDDAMTKTSAFLTQMPDLV